MASLRLAGTERRGGKQAEKYDEPGPRDFAVPPDDRVDRGQHAQNRGGSLFARGGSGIDSRIGSYPHHKSDTTTRTKPDAHHTRALDFKASGQIDCLKLNTRGKGKKEGGGFASAASRLSWSALRAPIPSASRPGAVARQTQRKEHRFGSQIVWIFGLTCGIAAFMSSTESAAAEKTAPTYHKDVVRILQKNCQDCHRPDQVAPFSLLTYEQARKRAADLAHVTAERMMPPWPASPSFGGPFRDARVLTDDEIATLKAWVEAKCPEGDPKDAPEPRDVLLGLAAGRARPDADDARAVQAGRLGRRRFSRVRAQDQLARGSLDPRRRLPAGQSQRSCTT